MRQAFAAWLETVPLQHRQGNGVEFWSWTAWQAAHERCAEICDDRRSMLASVSAEEIRRVE